MTWEMIGLIGNIIVIVSVCIHVWLGWKILTYYKLACQKMDAIEAMVDEESEKLVTAIMEDLKADESGDAKRVGGGVFFRKTPTKH